MMLRFVLCALLVLLRAQELEAAYLQAAVVSNPTPLAPVLTGQTIVGATPAVLNAPMHLQGAATTATLANSGGTPTSCNITAGDPSGNFQCAVVSGSVQIKFSSNGVSNLTGSTAQVSQTLTVTASNSGGTSSGVSVPVNVYADGSVNSPSCGSGTPSYPHLADVGSPGTQQFGRTLAARPEWLLPDIDYCIGIDRALYPTNAALKDPATISGIAGVSINTGTHVATISGANSPVLDGYDWSLNGGWNVKCNGSSTTTNLTISNGNFVIGANAQTAIWAVPSACHNITVTKSNVDGGSVTFAGGAGAAAGDLSINVAATATLTYNHLINAPGENIVLGMANSATGGVWNVNFNSIGNSGMDFDSGLHGDWIQAFNGTNAVTASASFDFNVLYQFAGVTGSATGPRTQGLSLWSAAGNAGIATNVTASYSYAAGTGVAQSSNGPYVNFQWMIIPKAISTSGNFIWINNYFDPSLYTASGTFTGRAAQINNSGAGTPTVGAQNGPVNGTYPPSTLFSASALPAGNINVMTGALVTTSDLTALTP